MLVKLGHVLKGDELMLTILEGLVLEITENRTKRENK